MWLTRKHTDRSKQTHGHTHVLSLATWPAISESMCDCERAHPYPYWSLSYGWHREKPKQKLFLVSFGQFLPLLLLFLCSFRSISAKKSWARMWATFGFAVLIYVPSMILCYRIRQGRRPPPPHRCHNYPQLMVRRIRRPVSIQYQPPFPQSGEMYS